MLSLQRHDIKKSHTVQCEVPEATLRAGDIVSSKLTAKTIIVKTYTEGNLNLSVLYKLASFFVKFITTGSCRLSIV